MKLRKLIALSFIPFLLTGCGSEPCKHVDNNHDGVCELCGETNIPVSHFDNNKDHKCDLCGKKISEHQTTLNSHYCSFCGEKISEHNFVPAVTDLTHECEICGITGDCVDTDCDYVCDICGRNLPEIPVHKSPFRGDIVSDGVHTGYEFFKENSTKQTSGIGSVEIFGFNDLHGIVKENIEENQAGLAKLGTVISSKVAQPNVLCFDQGDTWQGTLESNYGYGRIVQDVLSCANVSLRTIGNHDLDWGVEKYKEISARTYGEYSIPTLASNLYDYDWETKTPGTNQRSDLGQEYATFTMENGLKVGVVGVIGDDQITSISTQNVKDICFTDHNEKIKEMSDYLRTTKECDFVVASVHGSDEQTLGYGLTDISPVSNKRYVDLVLNSHTHQNVCKMENGVLFSQWGRYSEYIGSVTLKYNFDTNEVIDSSYDDRTSYNAKYMRTYFKDNDPEIDLLVQKYLESIENVATEVLSEKFDGEFASDEQLPNLMVEAIYKEAQKQGFNIDASVCNYARANFEKSTMTFSDLYQCFPFDNEVIIMRVKGRNSVNSIKYNFSYHEDENLRLNNNDEYLIGAVDYLALHTNANRYYDKFPNAVEVGKLTGPNGILTYRDILKNYLLSNPEKTFSSFDYSTGNWHFSL